MGIDTTTNAVLWKHPAPNVDYPLSDLLDGHAFVRDRAADGEPSLLCVDARTGQTLWRYDMKGPSGGARTPPALSITPGAGCLYLHRSRVIDVLDTVTGRLLGRVGSS